MVRTPENQTRLSGRCQTGIRFEGCILEVSGLNDAAITSVSGNNVVFLADDTPNPSGLAIVWHKAVREVAETLFKRILLIPTVQSSDARGLLCRICRIRNEVVGTILH